MIQNKWAPVLPLKQKACLLQTHDASLLLDQGTCLLSTATEDIPAVDTEDTYCVEAEDMSFIEAEEMLLIYFIERIDSGRVV